VTASCVLVEVCSRLDRVSLLSGVRALARRDRGLAGLVARHGPPPLWARRPGFTTLLRIILEQQVSLASAEALYNRLARRVRPLDPVGILRLGTAGLQGLGLTRQKAGYVYALADRVAGGQLALSRLGRCSDAEVLERLSRMRFPLQRSLTVPAASLSGIFRWASTMYAHSCKIISAPSSTARASRLPPRLLLSHHNRQWKFASP